MGAVVFSNEGFLDPSTPMADHLHERTHQHHSLWRYLTHKPVDPTALPNQPDVDIRDALDQYLVEVEVPGVKDADSIKCQWTSSTHLVVSGETFRPPGIMRRDGTTDCKTDEGYPKDGPPYLLVGERRVGTFKRHLNFPISVDTENMIATLEAGLLLIRIPKKKEHLPKGNGKVEVVSND